MIIPYENFLAAQWELPAKRNLTAIKKIFPPGPLRQEAFRRALEEEPDRADLWLGYAVQTAELGLYCEEDFDHCFSLIEKGLQAKNRGKAHARLDDLQQELEADLEERRHHQWIEPSPENTNTQSSAYSFHNRRWAEAEERAERELEIDPTNWYVWDLLIATRFAQEKPQEALETFERYTRARAQAHLHDIPHHSQLPILGYLAQTDHDAAFALIRRWLNAKTPFFRDEIRHNPLFSHLFSDPKPESYDLATVLREALSAYSPQAEPLESAELDFPYLTGTELSVWKIPEHEKLYIWLLLQPTEGIEESVTLRGDFVLRPDVLDPDKVSRLPNGSRSNIRRHLPHLGSAMPTPELEPEANFPTWKLTKISELPVVVKTFVDAVMEHFSVARQP